MTRILFCLVLTGCIGAPIVDVLPPPEEGGCMPAPTCDGLEEEHSFGDVPASTFEPADSSECLPPSAIVPEYCVPGRPSAWCALQAQGCTELATTGVLGEASAVGCRPALPVVVSGTLVLSDVDLSCSDVSFELAADASLVIRGSRLTGARIRVTGGERSILRLEETHGDGAFISLAGHAWLEALKCGGLEDLRIDVDPAVEGRAVALQEADHARLAVRMGARGELFLDRVGLSGATIDTGAMVTARGHVVTSRIRAEHLLVGGSRVEDVKLEIGRGVFSSVTSRRLEVLRCGELYIEGTQITSSYLAGCDAGFEMRGESAFTESVVRGSTLTNGGLFDSVVLAPGPGGLNRFEKTVVLESVFCDSPAIEAIEANLRCVACDPDIPSILLDGSDVVAPDCPSLDLAAMEQGSTI
jgi:hypothetical protein